MTRRARVAAGSVLAVTLLTSSAHAGTVKTVSPKRFATAFCGAFVEFRGVLTELEDDVNQAADRAVARSTAGDAGGIVDYVDDVTAGFLIAAESAGIAGTAMRDLPKPRVNRGAYIRRNLSRILGAAFDQLAMDFSVEAVALGSIADPAADVQGTLAEVLAAGGRIQEATVQLDDQVAAAFDTLDPDVDKDKKLERAFERAKACKPLFN